MPKAPRSGLSKPRELSGLSPLGSGRRRTDPRIDPGSPDVAAEIEGSETFRALVDAIDRQQVVVVRFQHETDERRICPVRIGIDAHDHYQVEAFQLSGPSTSETGTNSWKCFHIHSLEIVSVEIDGWAIGDRETARSRCFDQVVHPAPGTE